MKILKANIYCVVILYGTASTSGCTDNSRNVDVEYNKKIMGKVRRL